MSTRANARDTARCPFCVGGDGYAMRSIALVRRFKSESEAKTIEYRFSRRFSPQSKECAEPSVSGASRREQTTMRLVRTVTEKT